jgi:hypothetical protein
MSTMKPIKVWQFRFRTSQRKIRFEIREYTDRVESRLHCSRYGEDLGDSEEMMSAFESKVWPTLRRYDDDPRPLMISNNFTGERATIVGDADHFVAFVSPPKQC